MSDSSSEKVPTATEPQPGRVVATSGAPEPVKRLKEILTEQGVPREKAQVVLQQVTTEIIKAHAGPLPAVEDFEGYDRVCPGAARDIMNMAMHQQEHRNHMEKYEAASEFWLPVIGMAAAVVTIGACLLAGVALAFAGHTNEAISVLSGTLALTVIGAYLQRGKSAKEDTPPPEPTRTGPLTRREKRERASIVRRNLINRQ